MSGSSTFGSFEIGRRAIHAQQKGAHVTGQNIANANTQGYSRQIVHMKALIPPAVPGVMTPPGYGVAVSDIVRVRNEFYGDQLRKALTSQHYWETRKDTLTAIEVIFQEPGDHSINAYLSEFFDAWQDVSVNPESQAARISLRSQADTLTGIVRDIDDRLKDYRTDVLKELEANIAQINSIARELTEMNEKIMTFQALGKKSNELLDERDLLLEELSQLIDVRVIEKTNGAVEVIAGGRILLHDNIHFPLRLEKDEKTGEVELFNSSNNRITPQGGEMKGLLQSYNEMIPKYQGYLDELVYNLVMEVNHLHRQGYGMDGSTGINFFEPWSYPMPGDIIIDPDSLELGASEETNITGLSMSQDPLNQLFSGRYTLETIEGYDGDSRPLQDASDGTFIPTYSQNGRQLVHDVVINSGGEDINASIAFKVTKINGDEIFVNYEYRHVTREGDVVHANGIKRFTAGEENTFTVDGSDLALNIQLEDVGHFVEGDKFVINTMAEGDDSSNYDALILKDTDGNDVFGVVLEQGAFQGVQQFSFFQLNPATGEHREANLGVTMDMLLTEPDSSADPPVDIPAAAFTVGPYEPDNMKDYIQGAAQNFRVSRDIMDNLDHIAASSQWADDGVSEPGNGQNALTIAGLRETLTMGNGSTTFHEYLRSFVADLGVEGRESDRMSMNMKNVANSMREQQDAVSSVSLDDEMLNLIQFQHAYNAAAKFLSTFDRMLEVLIMEVGR